MGIKEFIEKLNKYCEDEYIYDIYYLDNDVFNLNWISTTNRDEHRWYVLAENIYKVTLNEEDYYLGVWEVETIKSQEMNLRDCDNLLKFYEMEQYSTISYSYKKKN